MRGSMPSSNWNDRPIAARVPLPASGAVGGEEVCERVAGGGDESLHLGAGLRRRLGRGGNLDRRLAHLELNVDEREREWMAERDQLRRALGGHDPRQLRRRRSEERR